MRNLGPRVSVIVPNFNGKHLLKECLDSIRNLNYGNYEVVVVDSSSTDGSVEMLKTEYVWARLLETERIPIGAACNRGMKVAEGKIIVTMLNNDMTVDKWWLNNLVKALSVREVGVVGGKIYRYGTNLIQSAGGWIDWRTCTAGQIGVGEEDKGQYDVAREVDYVDVPVVRKDVLDRIGGCDEEYYHYYVDTDYCVRARKAGYKVTYEPSAISWHRSSATIGASPKRQYYSQFRDGTRFLIKQCPSAEIRNATEAAVRRAMHALAINVYQKRADLVGAELDGILWNLINLSETLRSRHSDGALDQYL